VIGKLGFGYKEGGGSLWARIRRCLIMRGFPSGHRRIQVTVFRQNRLDSRCRIGYLVGFEGHNIYRIWIPSRKAVIRTRDVFFNENLKF
jgi:hypothetical protein